MKKEKIFSRGGYYSFIVQSNVLLHQEVIGYVAELIAGQFSSCNSPIRILDLACGGEPVSIIEAVHRNPNQRFTYTGVDINPDQVNKTRQWPHYPSNITQVDVIQGNAWLLKSLPLDGKYNIIFSGLNFHHATPEELYFLACGLHNYMQQDGLLINHDIFRPCTEPYLRRPDVNPNNSRESYSLVPPAELDCANIPNLAITGETFGERHYDWRDVFIKKYTNLLKGKGADPIGMDDILAHIYARDFPVSTDELSEILKIAGYRSEVKRFNVASNPITDYLALVVAYCPNTSPSPFKAA